jgi:hypothetical protein
MKAFFSHPICAILAMFGTIVVSGVILWPEFRPQIQTALRTIQNFIFWWQQ